MEEKKREQKVIYKIERAHVIYTQRFFPDSAYYDVIFMPREIIFVNRDDSKSWEAGMLQFGFLGIWLINFFMKGKRAKIAVQRTKTLEQQVAEDKKSKRLQYGEILTHEFKKTLGLITASQFSFKTQQGKYAILLPNTVLNEMAPLVEPLLPKTHA